MSVFGQVHSWHLAYPSSLARGRGYGVGGVAIRLLFRVGLSAVAQADSPARRGRHRACGGCVCSEWTISKVRRYVRCDDAQGGGQNECGRPLRASLMGPASSRDDERSAQQAGLYALSAASARGSGTDGEQRATAGEEQCGCVSVSGAGVVRKWRRRWCRFASVFVFRRERALSVVDVKRRELRACERVDG